ncbi:CotH kinase family protein [Elizabethkingia anophelis]|nr:CotH kinase family protein [Elizabethkingia anophelis]
MSSENNLLPFVKPIPVDKIPINNNPSAASTLIFADEQLNPRRVSIQYFNEKIASGVTGTIKTQQTLPELNALPDGVYRASTRGTYANGLTVAKGVLTLFKKVGTVWTVDTEVLMPNSTTPTWEPKEYEIGSQVFYDWSIYEAIVDTEATDVPGETPETIWKLKLRGVFKKNSDTLLDIEDPSGKSIATWDLAGNFFANYRDESIPTESVVGLLKISDAIKSLNTPNFFQLITADGKILTDLDKDGTLRVKRVIADSFETTAEVKENVATYLTSIVYPEINYLTVNYVGDMPTDSSPTRTPQEGFLEFYDGSNRLLHRIKTKVAIQGQSTAGLIKKGYSFDFMNEKGADLYIKFGSLPAVKGIHCKAFTTDLTHTRDVAAGKLWEQVIRSRPFPYNQFKILGNDNNGTPFNEFAFYGDSKFSLQGFPITLNNRGKFFGLYTFRLKKGLENYAMDGANQNHIFLDSTAENGIAVGLGDQSYPDFDTVSKAYENRSPKKKSITNTTKTNVMRFFAYWKGVFNNTNDLRATYQNYIILPAWVDFVVIAEALQHWDSVNNNASYLTYNGTHWLPGLADLDNTAGNGPRNPATMVLDKDVFPKFKTVFLPEIKARYTELRKNGILTNQNMVNLYGGIAKFIPMDVIKNNYAVWGTENYQGLITNMDGIYNYWNGRLAYLDSIWLNP